MLAVIDLLAERSCSSPGNDNKLRRQVRPAAAGADGGGKMAQNTKQDVVSPPRCGFVDVLFSERQVASDKTEAAGGLQLWCRRVKDQRSLGQPVCCLSESH